MRKKFQINPAPASLDRSQYHFVSGLADRQMSGRSAIMRQAIEALRRSPDTVANSSDIRPGGDPKVPYTVTLHITQEQSDYITRLAANKQISRSQILRNAVAALEAETTKV